MWYLKATALCALIALVNAVPVDKVSSKTDDEPESMPVPVPAEVEIPVAIENETDAPPATLTPPRRQIAYDQRQEGHYNIRADLENFVILVVPSSAASGANLLDLLTRAHGQKRNKHVQKKYHPQPDKFDEKKTVAGKLDYLKLRPVEPVEVIDQPRVVDEFIEGRTPYRVDISSTELLQPAPASPSGQLAQPLQPTLVRSLAPGNGFAVRESIAAPVATAIKGNIVEPATFLLPTSSNRYRKSLTTTEGNGNINTNSVVLTSLAHHTQRSRSSDLIDGGDIDILSGADDGTSDDDQYQAVDANEHRLSPEFIDLTDSNHSFDSVNIANLDLAAGSAKGGSNDQWQLELLGAQEQCGPDRRRDSYGVCQFVPSDYAP